jgi:hypothetical protein
VRAAAVLTVLLFAPLLRVFDAAGFLAEAAFASLFAAPRVRDAVAAAGLFRFGFDGFAALFFIFARTVFRAARALEAGLLLPARLRTLDDEASLRRRFDAGFALEAGLVFFVFDFVVFFDFLRAAIVNSPRATGRACAENMRGPALQ